MKKIALFIYNLYAWGIFVPFVIMALLVSWATQPFIRKNKQKIYFKIVGLFGAAWGFLVGILFFKSKSNATILDPKQAYVIVGNHISFLDIHAIGYGIPSNFLALSKVENKKLPIFGALISMGIFTVDRSSPESRIATMKKMTDLVKKGISIVVFPEGSRNKKLNQPLRKKFYDGAFRIAIEQQIPIIPMVITGCRRCMPYGSALLRPGRIGTYLFEPISTQGMTQEDLPELKQEVYDFMAEKLWELDPYLKKVSPQPIGDPGGIFKGSGKSTS